MKESYIENIEEAVCGRDLFRDISTAFRSYLGLEEFQDDTVTAIFTTQSEHDALPKPTPDKTIYFITDGG